jgi:hypothetical protein
MSATEGGAISAARLLQQDLQRIMGARRSGRRDRERLARVRRLCRAFRVRDGYCQNVVTAIEGCAVRCLSAKTASEGERAEARMLMLTLLQALSGRLQELEQAAK